MNIQETKKLIKQLINDAINSRNVSIKQAGNELASLLPENNANRRLIKYVAFHMQADFSKPYQIIID